MVMDGMIAAIADTATGAAFARAVEPAAGEGHATTHTRCLNCGTFLAGSHCHQCGQAANVHRNVAAFGHDLLHSVFHFEGKAWRTLPMLAWRPGELTRRYIEGERAQFVSPLALFLFTVFLTFAVFSWVGFGSDASDSPIRFDTSASVAELNRTIAASEDALVAARTAGEPTAPIARALAAQRAERDAAMRLAREGIGGAGAAISAILADVSTGEPTIDNAIAHMRENPDLTLYKLQSNSYKYSWMLIPLSAPFLWLLFPFSRRFGWYDHLVFVTYSISFMMLLWTGLRLLAVAGAPTAPLFGIAQVYPLIHIYRQLRGAYRCSRFGALLRTVILGFAALITLALGFVILVAVGAGG
jgi:hypothetical protein